MKSLAIRSALTLLLILPATALAQTTHVVNQSGLTFSPADITVEAGDTVRWVRSTGTHTVTSGTGAADPEVGNLFDAPLNTSNTSFEFTFTTAGDVPYFCRPHEGFGMTGIVRVTEVSAAGDLPAAALVLESPLPNPFNPQTEIHFTLTESATVDLEVFDVRGRLVRTLVRGEHREADSHRVVWNGVDHDGRGVPSGTYLFRVRAGGHEEVIKGALIR